MVGNINIQLKVSYKECHFSYHAEAARLIKTNSESGAKHLKLDSSIILSHQKSEIGTGQSYSPDAIRF